MICSRTETHKHTDNAHHNRPAPLVQGGGRSKNLFRHFNGTTSKYAKIGNLGYLRRFQYVSIQFQGRCFLAALRKLLSVVYILRVQCLLVNRKWQNVVMRLRVCYRLRCLMLAALKLFYCMFVAGVRVCRAVFIQMWYKNRIQTLYESVHSLSR